MNAKPVGSLRILRALSPFQVFASTALLSIGMVGVLRLGFEGRYYDFARSSMPGDVLLAAYLASVSYIARSREIPPGLHGYKAWHLTTMMASVLVATALLIRSINSANGEETIANLYHNTIVVSLLGYAVASTLPIVLASKSWKLQILDSALIIGWLFLLAIDLKQGNLDKNTPMRTSL